MNDVPAPLKETTPLRLPVRISEAVDKAVKTFVSRETGRQAHLRWHGADLWMIYANSVDVEKQIFVTRRVTIGVYSDDPDTLCFIPDILVTRLDGARYILPDTKRGNSKASASVFDLTRQVLQYSDMQNVTNDVMARLDSTWDKANKFSEVEAGTRLS